MTSPVRYEELSLFGIRENRFAYVVGETAYICDQNGEVVFTTDGSQVGYYSNGVIIIDRVRAYDLNGKLLNADNYDENAHAAR